MYILLLDPSHWKIDLSNRNAKAWMGFAWSSNSSSCDPCDVLAKSWSVEGAAIRVTGDEHAFIKIKKHMLAFSPRMGSEHGSKVTHEGILNLLQGARVHAQLMELSRE
jgi:hypothetical protein